MTIRQLDLREIEGDEARVAPFVAALEGVGAGSAGDGAACAPQFAASGKPPVATVQGWSADEFTASGKMEGKRPPASPTWAPPFTASGKATGKPTG